MSNELQNIILSPIPLSQLVEQLRVIVREELNAEQKDDSEKLITPSEACEFLSVSKTTLNKWEHSGLLTLHRLGGRTYFKKSEILAATKTHIKYKVTKPSKRR